jgi:UDP-N-acetylglucosamine transferase subunit ALG13
MAGGGAALQTRNLSGNGLVIFVTVGSSLPFDALIEAVDRFAGEGRITGQVTCQIGHGTYRPRNCDYFAFTPDFDEWVRKASLVIGHGGTGTVSTMLLEGKPFIAVPNPNVADDHQRVFLERLNRAVSFLWTTDLSALPELIRAARNFVPTAARGERLIDDLRTYLT